jgi:hypothetical protein
MTVIEDNDGSVADTCFTDDEKMEDEMMDDEMMDVPVSSENVGASVPSPEEMRTTVHVRHHSEASGARKRFIKLVMVALIVAAVVVAVAIGLSSSGGGSNKQRSSNNVQGGDSKARKSTADQVAALMASSGVSDVVALQTAGTPQNRAAFWLAGTDGANLAVPTDFGADGLALYKYTTRYVMVVLYYSTLGETAWDSQVGFMTSLDVCMWYSTFLSGNQPYRKGVVCDRETGLIIGLGISKWMRKMECHVYTSIDLRRSLT